VANLLGALFYPASTMTCTLVLLSQETGTAALMGSSRFRGCLQSACVLASRALGDWNGVGVRLRSKRSGRLARPAAALART
jgi:hypothetical protein